MYQIPTGPCQSAILILKTRSALKTVRTFRKPSPCGYFAGRPPFQRICNMPILFPGCSRVFHDCLCKGVEIPQMAFENPEYSRIVDPRIIVDDEVAKSCHRGHLFQKAGRKQAFLVEDDKDVLVVLWGAESLPGNDMLADIQADLHRQMKGAFDRAADQFIFLIFLETNVLKLLQVGDVFVEQQQALTKNVVFFGQGLPPEFSRAPSDGRSLSAAGNRSIPS